MSEGTEEFPAEEVRENQCGLILGCWDHEKTATLIQDLEHSVNLVERKCMQLFEELICYKKYLEETDGDFNFAVFKRKTQKSKNSHFYSGSEPNIAFRKNFLNFQEIQVFEEKFQAKLRNINKELREAAHKIGLKDNIILLHANDYLKLLKKQSETEADSCCYVPEEYVNLNFHNAKTKSDPVITEHAEEPEYSKITKNELELYQKLSRLSVKRRKKRKKSKERKVKFCVTRKTPKSRQGFLTCRTESKKQKSRKNKRKKAKRRTESHRNESPSPLDSFSTKCSQENSNESEIEKMCKSLNDALGMRKSHKSCDASEGREPAVEGNEALGAAVRKAVPFTACASTSRSYNIGLNMQQLLFLSKHGRKLSSSRIEKSHAGSRTHINACEEDISCRMIANDAEKGYAMQWMPEVRNNAFEDGKVTQVEQKGKVWVKENKMSNFRKVRSKYTGNSPEGFLEYHKSTMRQYANGRKSMIKSESKRAYAVGSKIMVSDCQRTDFFELRRYNNCLENASGDGTPSEGCARLSTEWAKVYGSFLSMCRWASCVRKYSSLKEKLTTQNLVPADEEVESLEKEIDCSIEKYKDFLQFYSKFLHLNHRLKSLKIGCQSKVFEPVTSVSSNFHGKLCSYRPTSSTTMKKVLREVQALQEKIRLVNT